MPTVRRELERLQREAAEAAAQTGRISANRAFREIQRTGDVARGAFGGASLAIQQAAFAVDDFFSVTGGLDQRIRAAGNNLSQLGFILGGTTGLIAGISLSIGGQLVAALIRWANGGQQAEDATKALNAALESQGDKVRELADAYKSLASEIANAGLSEESRQRFERRTAVAERERQGIAAAIDIAASRSPRLASARGAVDAAAERRRNAIGVNDALAAAQDERAAQARLQRREQALEQRIRRRLAGFAESDPAADTLRADQIRVRQQIGREQRLQRLGVSSGRRIGGLREQDAFLEAAIFEANRRQQERLTGFGQGISDRFAPLNERLGEVGFTQAGAEIERLIESIRQAQADLADGSLSTEGLTAFIDATTKAANAAEASARSLLSLNDALQRLGGNLARTVEQDAAGLQDQLRRDANRAEASFGPNDQRTVQARGAEGAIDVARRQAAAGRLAIDRQIADFRNRVQADAAAGRGDRRLVGISRRIAAQQGIIDDERSTPAQRQQAQFEIEGLNQRFNEIVDSLPDGLQIKRRADELDIGLQNFIKTIEDGQKRAEQQAAFNEEIARRRAAPDGDPIRGLDLAQSAAERAGREIAQGLADINAAYDAINQNILQGGGLDKLKEINANEQLRNAALERFQQEQAQRIAPLLFDFAQEVQNAIAQGPSRAALGASDASTLDGQQELNRLLRGDDTNRNVDLVELQKQANNLLEAIAKNTEEDAPVAN